MYPKRTDQKVSESKSLLILQDILPQQWIFRHESSDDFGIDIEIELVTNEGFVNGNFFKAQVKSKNSIVARKEDNTPTVSNIKQSTLSYWISLNKYIHIIAFLVNLETKDVYWTPVFWQATKLFDGSDKTKTILFKNDSLKRPDSIFELIAHILSPNVFQIIDTHKRLIRTLMEYINLLDEALYSDPWTLIHNDELFRTFLEECRILCWKQLIFDEDNLCDYYKWKTKSEEEWNDSIMQATASLPLSKLFPMLIEELKYLKKDICEGEYFWSNHFEDYFNLVKRTKLPEKNDLNSILDWGNNLNRY